jgi:hypothetical protein
VKEADPALLSLGIGPPDGVPVLTEEVSGAILDGLILRFVQILRGTFQAMRLDLLYLRPLPIPNVGMEVANPGDTLIP